MTIAFFDVRPEREKRLKEKVGKEFPDVTITFSRESLAQESMPGERGFEIAVVSVSSKLGRDVIEALPNLKHVTTRSTGFDHIDLEACKEKGIAVSNVPSYGESTVAEFTFALILMLSRRAHLSQQEVRKTGQFHSSGICGFDLEGKTLGVIGTGKIGCHTIKIAKGFGMNVVAHDAHPKEKAAKELGFAYMSFDDVLRESDIVTLHVPYTEDTHHLMDEAAFQKMKKGSYLINTSRGGVVDTLSLARALQDGHLAGAGLDVVEEEVMRAGARSLMDLPNVVITPHGAFHTTEALERILDVTVMNIKAFLSGKPTNVVE